MSASKPDGRRRRARIHPSYREAVKFLKRWSENGPWVLTAIDPDKRAIDTQTFRPESETAMLRWLEKQGAKRNIYFTVNPVTRDLDNKPSREHIRELAWLHVDLDPRAGEDLDNERLRIRSLLGKPDSKGLPKPTVITFSGGGFQGFWKLKEPLRLDGSAEDYEEAKRYNKQVETLLGGDNCHNVDRIMRLPGTVNRPDRRKRSKGRTEALAAVEVWEDDRVYDLDEFQKAPPDAAKPKEARAVEIDTQHVMRFVSVDDIDELKERPQCRVVICQGIDPDDPDKHPSRSEWQHYVCCEMVRAGCDDETIYSVITDPAFGVSATVLEKGAASEEYAVRQIERARAEAAVDAEHPILREINDEYALVTIGGKGRVLREHWDAEFDRPAVTYLLKEAFLDFWNKRTVELQTGKGKTVSKPAGTWWVRHPLGRAYRDVVYAPGRELPSDTKNLWRGFAVDPTPGDCELYLAHLWENVCGGDEEHYNYLVRWMAYAVQKPGEPGHVAVALRGEKGTGKGVLAEHFGALWGRHFVQIVNPKHLLEFNSLIEEASIVFLDEAISPKDKRHEAVLKAMTTERYVNVERKGVDVRRRPNVLHLILASNDLSVVRATGDERRYFVLDVSNARRQDHAYFAAIDAQMQAGGYGALLKLLLEMDLSGFNVRRAPKTAALQDQVDRNLRPEDEWLFTLLDNGVLPNNKTRTVNGEPCVILNRAWWGESEPDFEDGLVDDARRTVPKLRNESEKALTAYLDDWGITSPEKGGRRSRVFPPLPELRAAWCEKHGPREWSGGADADWALLGADEEDEDGAFG